MNNEIFIPGNVPSSKNTKQWTGKYLVWSKVAQKYVKDTEYFWKQNKELFYIAIRNKSNPLQISFKFIRKSKHKFDYVNPLQTILDLMVRYDWIEDDNADIILPVFEPYEYNKDNPGVIIKIL
jgi:hypothetical protein